MGTFRCVICTPTAKLFDEDVSYASVPSDEGYYGVLPGHELLVGLHSDGGLCTVNLDEAGTQKKEFLVYKGASQMFNGILTVLGSFGVEPSNINREAVEGHAQNMRALIDDLKKNEDAHDKVRIAILKRLLEWDEFQLDYLAKQGK